jgi:hypothetical protein
VHMEFDLHPFTHSLPYLGQSIFAANKSTISPLPTNWSLYSAKNSITLRSFSSHLSWPDHLRMPERKGLNCAGIACEEFPAMGKYSRFVTCTLVHPNIVPPPSQSKSSAQTKRLQTRIANWSNPPPKKTAAEIKPHQIRLV